MSMSLNEIISLNVRMYLSEQGKTQKALADHFGVTSVSMHNKINGRDNWRAPDIEKAAEFLGIEPAALLAKS